MSDMWKRVCLLVQRGSGPLIRLADDVYGDRMLSWIKVSASAVLPSHIGQKKVQKKVLVL